MSRFNRLWVLLVPAVFVLAGLGMNSPAHADEVWNPPAPVPSDECGVSQDRSYIPDSDPATAYYKPNGESLAGGVWYGTGGASTVTVIARNYINPDKAFTMSFGTEADSTCVEAADTVTTEIVSCNTDNTGTRVKFTYTNVDDATNWLHTWPQVKVERWDRGQTAYVVFTEGQVPDGQWKSITGGDTLEGADAPDEFFLSPGTYSLTLRTTEYSWRLLPNRLFVPTCDGRQPPPGDPLGGPIPNPDPPAVNRPTATISACNVRTNRVRVLLDGRKATRTTKYRLVIDPKRGKTVVRTYYVGAKQYKSIVLRKQRTGTLVKVSFAGKVVQRRLRC